jgi:hypothetical protein
VSVTAACVIFAAVGQIGLDGFLDRLFAASVLASPLLPVLEFYFWWRKNGLDKV